MASAADDIILQLQTLSANGQLAGNEDARKKALALSKQLTASLEDPVNTASELALVPLVSMAARVAVDLDLFGLIGRHDGPITASELAKETGAEELLISRMMRVMTSVGFAKEAAGAVDSYEPTPVTQAMASSPLRSGYNFELLIGCAVKAPKFLKETGYRCPEDPHDGFIQYAFQTKLNMFGFLASNPEIQGHFNNFMGNTMGNRKHWIEWFPVQTELIDGTNPETPLLVDVGGGKGHDIDMFRKHFPNSGRLVLEDSPVVIDGIKELDQAIERVPYDFFTDQPITGARAYFFHHIFHDWSDTYCLKIFKKLRPAMKPGYSRLLIHELILPDSGCLPFQAIFDMTMMAFNAGMERSQRQWTKLLDEAGFEVVKFWYPEDDGDGIIEAIVLA